MDPGGTRRADLSRWRPRRGARATAGALVAVAVGVASTAPGSGAGATGPVRPGQASANAALLSVAVQSGGTSLKPTAVGRASAAYVETQTQASSAVVDPGGVGFLLNAIPICGQVLLPSSRQPQPLTASSADGPSARTTPGNAGGAGTQSVQVSPVPEEASATTAPFRQDLLGGLVTIEGTASSAVRYVDGTEQRAESTVTADLVLAGGLVRIDGMRWAASQRVGRSSTASATFELGTVTVAGAAPIRAPGGAPPAAAITTANAVLGLVGLRLSLPTDTSDPATSTTAIGPLRVHVAGSDLDRTLVTPAAQQIAALEAAIGAQSANGPDCSQVKNLIGNLANPGDTVANIVVGTLQGAGSVDLDIGGANASTRPATDFANPFAAGGDQPSSDGAGGSGASPSVAAGPGAPAPTAAVPADELAAPTPFAAGAPASASAPAGLVPRPAGALRCSTTSPAGRPGCSSGLGALVGGVAATAAVGVLVGDVVYGRRTRRRRRRRATS